MDNNFYNENQQYPSRVPVISEEKKQPALDTTTYLVLSIVGLALSTILGMPLAGLIVSIIAMNKGKTYFSLGGKEKGEARAAKILSLLGVIFGIIGTVTIFLVVVFYVLYILGIFGLAFLAAGM